MNAIQWLRPKDASKPVLSTALQLVDEVDRSFSIDGKGIIVLFVLLILCSIALVFLRTTWNNNQRDSDQPVPSAQQSQSQALLTEGQNAQTMAERNPNDNQPQLIEGQDDVDALEPVDISQLNEGQGTSKAPKPLDSLQAINDEGNLNASNPENSLPLIDVQDKSDPCKPADSLHLIDFRGKSDVPEQGDSSQTINEPHKKTIVEKFWAKAAQLSAPVIKKSKQPGPLQLIDEQGKLDKARLDAFIRHEKLADGNPDYTVITIMGPQSSGKSTLLNRLFDTSFLEMDARSRKQTTKGIWLAHAAKTKRGTLVMDVEGTDSGERGEDDTSFEKRSALFALTVSDILLINMWEKDVGLPRAGNKTLLTLVFQIMMKQFGLEKKKRKTSLMFVIRDISEKAFMEDVDSQVRKGVDEMWTSVKKPSQLQNAKLEDYFNVQVTALPHIVHFPEEFESQIKDLQEEIIATPGFQSGSLRAIQAKHFPGYAQEIWEKIMNNKDVDIPGLLIIYARIQCEERRKEMLNGFSRDQKWIAIRKRAENEAVPCFGETISTLLTDIFDGYDKALYCDENVIKTEKEKLIQEAFEAIQPTYELVVSHHHVEAMNTFESQLKNWADIENPPDTFDEAYQKYGQAAARDLKEGVKDAQVLNADWNLNGRLEKLQKDMQKHASVEKGKMIRDVVSSVKSSLEDEVQKSTKDLLEDAECDTWHKISSTLEEKVGKEQEILRNKLPRYSPSDDVKKRKLEELASFGRQVVETVAKETAGSAYYLMVNRFNAKLNFHLKSEGRRYFPKEVYAAGKDARSSAKILLFVLAAIQLDGKTTTGLRTLLDNLKKPRDPSKSIKERVLGFFRLRRSSQAQAEADESDVHGISKKQQEVDSWDPAAVDRPGREATKAKEQTLLAPKKCVEHWEKFKSEADRIIEKTVQDQRLKPNILTSLVHLMWEKLWGMM